MSSSNNIHFFHTVCVVTGIEKLMKTYSENPSFSNQKNLEDTEELHDEVNNVQHEHEVRDGSFISVMN